MTIMQRLPHADQRLSPAVSRPRLNAEEWLEGWEVFSEVVERLWACGSSATLRDMKQCLALFDDAIEHHHEADFRTAIGQILLLWWKARNPV
jgi:hypothetical protein